MDKALLLSGEYNNFDNCFSICANLQKSLLGLSFILPDLCIRLLHYVKIDNRVTVITLRYKGCIV